MQINTFLPDINIEVLGLSTRGDEQLETDLSKIGGKGLFTKELEQALLNGTADLAVHSMKDIPVDTTDTLTITAVCEREDPHDVWVSQHYSNWHLLPKNARVGTSSLRRQMQLLALRPDLTIIPLRGNIGTRLAKLNEGKYDGIVLAAAGLIRLGLENKIVSRFSFDEMLPAVGQGILGLQIAKDNTELAALLKPINCENSWQCLMAERRVSEILGTSCQTPFAAFANIDEQHLHLRAKLGTKDCQHIIKTAATLPLTDAKALGTLVANQLYAAGARDML